MTLPAPSQTTRHVGVGDAAFGAGGTLVLATHGLGSCVAVVAWDPVLRVGGLVHFQLPEAALDPARARETPYTFGDIGVQRFFDVLASHGAYAVRSQIYLVGGAHVARGVRSMAIGPLNVEVARAVVRGRGGQIAGEAVGGREGRTVWIRLADGAVTVRDTEGRRRSW